MKHYFSIDKMAGRIIFCQNRRIYFIIIIASIGIINNIYLYNLLLLLTFDSIGTYRLTEGLCNLITPVP